MIGLYYVDSRKIEKLFVVYNLLAVRKNRKVEVILDPTQLSNPGAYLRKNRISLERGLIAAVDVPNEQLKELGDYCFDNRTDEAEIKAREIFLFVKRNWRRIKINRK